LLLSIPNVTEFADPELALHALASELLTTATERTSPVVGRILAEPIHADRDSPAIDVSAMDGYAIRLQDLQSVQVLVSGEMQPGQPPFSLQEGTACRVFTGAAIPVGAEAVVMREDTDESLKTSVSWRDRAKQTSVGKNIRFQGENGRAGDLILPSGSSLTASQIAAAANFGAMSVMLHRRVRVSIIVTGNELLDASQSPQPWQLRDSNGPTIAAICSPQSWIECRMPMRCPDNAAQMTSMLSEALAESDAIILTGGVSKGDYDHVPAVIASLGAKTIFHRLPIRPGRPILGAATSTGKLILGLPGNPVSAAVNMVRFGLPLLAKQSGKTVWSPAPAKVLVNSPNDQSIPLHWYRLVRMIDDAKVELIESRGSGDLVSLAKSTGFIHQPPGASGPGPWEYHAW
jgi:molybdopterin molybdotransferase